MILTNTRYSDGVGFVRDEYEFNENKTDYVVLFKNGRQMKQLTPFDYVYGEWLDGNYHNFVAKFGNNDGATWYTPIELLCFMVKDGATIKGIERIIK